MTPPDPLFAQQWHLSEIGDIAAVWNDYTGEGVAVAVYDAGLEYTHPDLFQNYDAAAHVLTGGTPNDPFPTTGGHHATSVAGIIAAASNGIGGVGVAFDASLTGVGWLTASFADALAMFDQLSAFHITNHSWGFNTQDFAPDAGVSAVAARFAAAASVGRNGLGTIHVKSSGNDDKNANGDAVDALRSTIVVSAFDDLGGAAFYSNYGANVLISAPSNGGIKDITTTDRTGATGLSSGDYTDAFGGTSAAAPVVSGVVALMLEANPSLGWRDVQEILALTATEVGSGVGAAPAGDEDFAWRYNGASTHNGGGLHFSEDYGFGAVDAFGAVRLAEVWSRFGAPATSENEAHVSASAGSTALPDQSVTAIVFTVAGGVDVENVTLALDLDHWAFDDLVITLRSPSGTETTLIANDGARGTARGGWLYTVSANAFRAEGSGGAWTLTITDSGAGFDGTLRAATLNVYGTASSEDDVFHLTNELSKAVQREPHRAHMDGGGGVDWLNAAALSTASFIHLGTGAFTVDDTEGTAKNMENAAAGDGDDTIFGSAGDNLILGLRGADMLRGAAGEDTVEGGDGRDSLFGGEGADTLLGGADNDIIRSEGGNDSVEGGPGRDTILGGAGEDDLSGGADGDLIRGGTGGDVLSGRGGADTLYGEDGADVLEGGGAGDVALGGGGSDTIIDTGGGNDTLRGNDGNDTIEGGGGDDVLIGGADADRLLGQSGADRLIGEGGGDTLRGGSGADTLIGDDGADFLAGDTGADTLRPGTGEDTLNGGSGADYLDAAADSMRDIFQFGTGFGNDVIAAFEAGIDKLDFRQNAQVSGFGDLRLIEKGADMVVRIVGVPDDFVTVRNAAATLGEADIFV